MKLSTLCPRNTIRSRQVKKCITCSAKQGKEVESPHSELDDKNFCSEVSKNALTYRMAELNPPGLSIYPNTHKYASLLFHANHFASRRYQNQTANLTFTNLDSCSNNITSENLRPKKVTTTYRSLFIS